MEKAEAEFLSIQTYMKLFQRVKNKNQHKTTKDFLYSKDFIILPFTKNIAHRVSIYIEEYSLSSNLRAGDAIIVATAVENNLVLVSGNAKHFKP